MFGVFLIEDKPIAITLERPWLDNKREVSCIPVGTYIAKRIISPSHGEVFEIVDVPNRTNILIHIGNVLKDSAGCILIGRNFGTWSDGSCCILNSGLAFDEFMRSLKGINEFTLTINECFN